MSELTEYDLWSLPPNTDMSDIELLPKAMHPFVNFAARGKPMYLEKELLATLAAAAPSPPEEEEDEDEGDDDEFEPQDGEKDGPRARDAR